MQWRGDEPLPRDPDVGEASEYLIEYLRIGKGAASRYGCDAWMEDVIAEYLFENTDTPRERGMNPSWSNPLAPSFLAAAWDLCRFGVLRPGGHDFAAHSAGQLQSFSITPFGKTWLAESPPWNYVPTSFDRLSKLLDAFTPRFGNSYHERAIDAARCYSAHAYFACCAMVGAAAESILLTVGEVKLGEDVAVKTYTSGTSRLEKRILANCGERVKRGLPTHTGLIGVWRGYSAHAAAVNLSEDQALMALRGLLHFSHFAEDNWKELTAN